MPTQATVYQNTLRLLGEPSNVTVDSDKKIVREMTGAYASVVRKCFEMHPWNEFKKLEQLSQVSPAELGWDYTFNRPAAFVRVVLVSNTTDEDDLEGIEYAYRRGKFLSNHETTYLWFISSEYEATVGSWPQSFADMVSAYLADEVYPVNDEGDATRSRIDAAMRDRKQAAIALDASTDPVVRQPSGNYVRGRSRGVVGRSRYRGY